MTLLKLKECQNKKDFAKLVGFQLKTMSYIVYKIEDDKKYFSFEIPKKNNSTREIHAPCEKLKNLQKRLKSLLDKCYFEIATNKKSVNGFLSGKSILTNAKYHKNKRYVLNIDLKDFFPSINFGRVYGYFLNNKKFKLSKSISALIAAIACHNNELPQGSPCSPIISNFIALSLDKGLNILANKYKLSYTRYVDDITLSTNLKEFPKDIAQTDDGIIWTAGDILKKYISDNGFVINEKKINMQYRTSRQKVTGIVVNKKLNVNRMYIRKTRAQLYKWIKNSGDNKELKVIKGKIAFIYQVRTYQIKTSQLKKYEVDSLTKKLYENVFYIENCIRNKYITIITEGKTDKTYINTAFSHFKDQYDFNLNIITHSKMLDEMLILNGASNLQKFINQYGKYINKYVSYYKIDNPQNIVIVLFDRDEPNILKNLKIINNDTKKIIDYLYKGNNLYCCTLPELDDKEYFSIEYYFPKEILERKFLNINGEILKLKLEQLNENDETDKKLIYKIGESGLSKKAFSKYIQKLKYQSKENNEKSIEDTKNKQYFNQFEKLFDLIKEINNDWLKRCNS